MRLAHGMRRDVNSRLKEPGATANRVPISPRVAGRGSPRAGLLRFGTEIATVTSFGFAVNGEPGSGLWVSGPRSTANLVGSGLWSGPGLWYAARSPMESAFFLWLKLRRIRDH